jgi:Flp pilus assembly protein TadG
VPQPRGPRAQALVEAAASFPLLVLLLLAMVEGALYVHALHVVRGAAREGAHAAAAEHATVDEAITDGRARAREVLAAGLGQYADTIQVLDPSVGRWHRGGRSAGDTAAVLRRPRPGRARATSAKRTSARLA